MQVERVALGLEERAVLGTPCEELRVERQLAEGGGAEQQLRQQQHLERTKSVQNVVRLFFFKVVSQSSGSYRFVSSHLVTFGVL